MVDEPHTAAIRYEAGICPNEVTQLNVFFWREASPLTLCKYFNPVLCNCLQALRVENENETKLGEAGELVEADETAFGQRKYHRGKRQRKQDVVWFQTAVKVKEVAGKRQAQKLRASYIPDKTKDTMEDTL